MDNNKYNVQTIFWLTKSYIESIAAKNSYNRGLNILDTVLTMHQLPPDSYKAIVKGHFPYEINIKTEDDNNKLVATCSCPDDRGGICKHIVATLTHLLPSQTSKLGSTTRYIEFKATVSLPIIKKRKPEEYQSNNVSSPLVKLEKRPRSSLDISTDNNNNIIDSKDNINKIHDNGKDNATNTCNQQDSTDNIINSCSHSKLTNMDIDNNNSNSECNIPQDDKSNIISCSTSSNIDNNINQNNKNTNSPPLLHENKSNSMSNTCSVNANIIPKEEPQQNNQDNTIQSNDSTSPSQSMDIDNNNIQSNNIKQILEPIKIIKNPIGPISSVFTREMKKISIFSHHANGSILRLKYFPNISIDGMGRLAFPICNAQLLQIKELYKITNTTENNTKEIIFNDKSVIIGNKFTNTINELVKKECNTLGVSKTCIPLEIFDSLRICSTNESINLQNILDDKKCFGILIIYLPSYYTGGNINIYYKEDKFEKNFDGSIGEENFTYKIFYNICDIQQSNITKGYQLSLIYKLYTTNQNSIPRPLDYSSIINNLYNISNNIGCHYLVILLSKSYTDFKDLEARDLAFLDILSRIKDPNGRQIYDLCHGKITDSRISRGKGFKDLKTGFYTLKIKQPIVIRNHKQYSYLKLTNVIHINNVPCENIINPSIANLIKGSKTSCIIIWNTNLRFEILSEIDFTQALYHIEKLYPSNKELAKHRLKFMMKQYNKRNIDIESINKLFKTAQILEDEDVILALLRSTRAIRNHNMAIRIGNILNSTSLNWVILFPIYRLYVKVFSSEISELLLSINDIRKREDLLRNVLKLPYNLCNIQLFLIYCDQCKADDLVDKILLYIQKEPFTIMLKLFRYCSKKHLLYVGNIFTRIIMKLSSSWFPKKNFQGNIELICSNIMIPLIEFNDISSTKILIQKIFNLHPSLLCNSIWRYILFSSKITSNFIICFSNRFIDLSNQHKKQFPIDLLEKFLHIGISTIKNPSTEVLVAFIDCLQYLQPKSFFILCGILLDLIQPIISQFNPTTITKIASQLLHYLPQLDVDITELNNAANTISSLLILQESNIGNLTSDTLISLSDTPLKRFLIEAVVNNEKLITNVIKPEYQYLKNIYNWLIESILSKPYTGYRYSNLNLPEYPHLEEWFHSPHKEGVFGEGEFKGIIEARKYVAPLSTILQGRAIITAEGSGKKAYYKIIKLNAEIDHFTTTSRLEQLYSILNGKFEIKKQENNTEENLNTEEPPIKKIKLDNDTECIDLVE